MAAKTKVKDLAKKHGVSTAVVLEELKTEGIEAKNAGSVIPDDYVDIVDEHLTGKFSSGAAETAGGGELHIKPPIVVKQLADAMGKKPNELVSALISMNILASINQTLEPEVAKKLCAKFGFDLVLDRRVKTESKPQPEDDEAEDKPEDLVERPPVVTFLGHVDHGKTSLQDSVRKTDVVAGEAGGITQHIGASIVSFKGRSITFIDTPGHEAFTAMRARGANVTDIAVLVVAADDGFMPQTIEALKHAQAAEVPVIVAINKIDLASADVDKILRQMSENGIMSEDWGGDTAAIKVSATRGDGIDELLERILLEAEILELKANPKARAKSVVLEAQLEQGLGATANILVTNGTLKVGDPIICDDLAGKIKTMIDARGKRVKQAGPSTPVKLVGLSSVPEAGAKLVVCSSEKEARQLAKERADDKRQTGLSSQNAPASLEDLFGQMAEAGDRADDLRVIIKSDVSGSGEAIADSLKKLPSDKIRTSVVANSVGAITENDILLASASNAIVVGFHVRVNPGVNAMAKREGVEIRLYSIIYELLEDITDALTGRLDPEKREKPLGKARILQIFNLNKGPKICGCMVESGLVRVGAKARVFRGGELIFNGGVESLRRFQDDVKEVRQGLECGIRIGNFRDLEEKDEIEFYDIELKKATL